MDLSCTWQEIASQPETWQAVLEAFAANQSTLTPFLSQANPDQILVTGCGSTFYLARAAAATLAHRVSLPTWALPASELWLYGNTPTGARPLLLAVSRSGTTTETLRATDRFKATGGGSVLVVTCYPESPLAQKADAVLACPEAQEQSVAQTRSFSSMFILTQALAAVMAKDDRLLSRMGSLPATCSDLVARLGDLARRLGEDLDLQRLFFLGGGALYGLACEAMLKTKEMSLSYSEAFHPMEIRHGPMSMVDEQTLVIGLLSDTGLEQELAVLRDMQALGGRTLALVEDDTTLGEPKPDYVVPLNSGLGEWERGALYLPVLQRLAFHRAIAKGLDPDRPHNLKAVIEL